MTSSRWLRILSGVLGLFTIGHTLGTAVPRVTRGADQAAVFAAMQRYAFAVNGVHRTYWDFYRGFALTISVLLLMMTVVSWSLATLAQQSPRHTLALTVTLQCACAGLLALSWTFFFAVPVVMSAAAFLAATGAVVALLRESALGSGRLALDRH